MTDHESVFTRLDLLLHAFYLLTHRQRAGVVKLTFIKPLAVRPASVRTVLHKTGVRLGLSSSLGKAFTCGGFRLELGARQCIMSVRNEEEEQLRAQTQAQSILIINFSEGTTTTYL